MSREICFVKCCIISLSNDEIAAANGPLAVMYAFPSLQLIRSETRRHHIGGQGWQDFILITIEQASCHVLKAGNGARVIAFPMLSLSSTKMPGARIH